MKCINCQTDNKYQERTENGSKCKQCGHPFCFEPKDGGLFSDTHFLNSLKFTSSEGNNFFTRKQFAYTLENRLFAKMNYGLGGYIFAFLFLSPFLIFGVGGFLVLLLFVLVSLYTLLNFVPLSAMINIINYMEALIDHTPIFILILVVSLAYISVHCIFSAIMAIKLSKSPENSPKHRQQHMAWVKVLIGGELLLSIILLLTWSFDSNRSQDVGLVVFILFLIGIMIGSYLMYLAWQISRNRINPGTLFPHKTKDLDRWIEQWARINGTIDKLLPSPKDESAEAFMSPEIVNYSFDRLIVCDTSTLAQFLLANNIHIDHQCAILSITGYPQTVFSTILEMVKSNPNLAVYTLHDASPRGVSLVHHLRSSRQWFLGSQVVICDMGLKPSHVLANPNLYIRKSTESKQQAQSLPQPVRQTLSADELAWLDQGLFVELESFTPKKLLQIVRQTLTLNRTEWQNENFMGATETEIAIYSSASFG